MLEIFGTLLLLALAIAYFQGVKTALQVAFLLGSIVIVCVGSLMVVGYTGSVRYGLVVAIAAAIVFGFFRFWQIRILKELMADKRKLKARISANNKKFGAVGVDGEGSVV